MSYSKSLHYLSQYVSNTTAIAYYTSNETVVYDEMSSLYASNITYTPVYTHNTLHSYINKTSNLFDTKLKIPYNEMVYVNESIPSEDASTADYYYYSFTDTSINASNYITFSSNTVCDILIVGGGGSGAIGLGGGSSGGLLYAKGVNIPAGNYPITVGVGGVNGNGGDSAAFGATAKGGLQAIDATGATNSGANIHGTTIAVWDENKVALAGGTPFRIDTTRKYPPKALVPTTATSQTKNTEISISGEAYGNTDATNKYKIDWSREFNETFQGVHLFNGSTTDYGALFKTGNYSTTGANAKQYIGTDFIKSDYKGEWVKLTLPIPIFLQYVKLYPRPANGSLIFDIAPADFKVYGSNDSGTTWTEIINVVGATYGNFATNELVPFVSAYNNIVSVDGVSANTTAYKMYGLVVNKITGTNFNLLNFNELEFWGNEIPTPSGGGGVGSVGGSPYTEVREYPRHALSGGSAANYVYTADTLNSLTYRVRVSGNFLGASDSIALRTGFNQDITDGGWGLNQPNPATIRTGYAGVYVMIDLFNNVILDNFVIYPIVMIQLLGAGAGREDKAQRMPKYFRLYATNTDVAFTGTDGPTTGVNHSYWTLLYERTSAMDTGGATPDGVDYSSQTTTTPMTVNTNTITTGYRYYMLLMNTNWGDSWGFGFAEWTLNGKELISSTPNGGEGFPISIRKTYELFAGGGGANGGKRVPMTGYTIGYGGNSTAESEEKGGDGIVIISVPISKDIESVYYNNKIIDLPSASTSLSYGFLNNPSYYYYAFTDTTKTNYITFNKNTICDILIVGGGGSGAIGLGGGSSGGLLYSSNVIIPSGTYPITVGVGGVNGNGGDSVAFGATAKGGMKAIGFTGATNNGANIPGNTVAVWNKDSGSLAGGTPVIEYTAVRKYPPTGLTGGTISNQSISQTPSGSPSYGTGTYNISWSTQFASGYPPYEVFDGNTGGIGGHWEVSSLYSDGTYQGSSNINGYEGDWIKIKLPTSIYLSSVKMYQRSGYARAPVDFKVFGKNDSTNWIEVISKVGATYSSLQFQTSEGDIVNDNNNTAYNEYVLVANKIGTGQNGNVLNFTELELYGKEPISSTPSGGGGVGSVGGSATTSASTPNGGTGFAVSIRTPNEIFAGGGGANGGTRIQDTGYTIGYGGNSSSTIAEDGGDGIVIVRFQAEIQEPNLLMPIDKITGSTTTVLDDDLTPNKVVITDADGKINTSNDISLTEFEYLSGVTYDIQQQFIDTSNYCDIMTSNINSNILDTSNVINSNLVNINSYLINTSNELASNVNFLNLENINVMADTRKVIVNNTYNDNLIINAKLTVNSNLNVSGTTTEIFAPVFNTEALEINTLISLSNPILQVNYTGTSNILEIYSNTSIKAVVSKEGYLGIGNTNPQFGIDVSSNINISGNYKINGTNLSYYNMSNIPLTFNPSVHNHIISDITDLQTQLDSKQDIIPSISSVGDTITINTNVNLTTNNNYTINGVTISSSGEVVTQTPTEYIAPIVEGTSSKIISGTSYQYAAFTNVSTTNSIEFLQNTVCDILIVGGGGSGAIGLGGGSSGGLLYSSNVIIPSGTYPITVGAGGVNGNGGDSAAFGATAKGGLKANTSIGATNNGANIPGNTVAVWNENKIALAGGTPFPTFSPVEIDATYSYYAFTTVGNNGITFNEDISNCEILIVGGGGGGGSSYQSTSTVPGAGGGAGGLIFLTNQIIPAGNYIVVVGNGGDGDNPTDNTYQRGKNGENSSFSYLQTEAIGGGGGASRYGTTKGGDGGSGGGSVLNIEAAQSGGSGYVSDIVKMDGTVIIQNYRQGYDGGETTASSVANSEPYAGGGGGAGEKGKNNIETGTGDDGDGGDGISGFNTIDFKSFFGITDTSIGEHHIDGKVYFAGGGGTGYRNTTTNSSKGGLGGGADSYDGDGLDGQNNTGGGGSGSRAAESRGQTNGGNGGSGIVIIRVPTSTVSSITAYVGTPTPSGGGGVGSAGGSATTLADTPNGGNGFAVSIRTPSEIFAGGGGANGGTRIPDTGYTIGYGGSSSSTIAEDGGDGIVIVRWNTAYTPKKTDSWKSLATTTQPIVNSYNFYNETSNLLVWYKFDQEPSNGLTLTNYGIGDGLSSLKYNGTITMTGAVGATLSQNNEYYPDTSNYNWSSTMDSENYISVNNAQELLDTMMTSDYSISFWKTSYDVSVDYSVYARNDSIIPTTDNANILLRIQAPSSDNIVYYDNGNFSATTYNRLQSTAITEYTGIRQLYTFTRKIAGANEILSTYINGVLLITETYSLSQPVVSSSARFYIGLNKDATYAFKNKSMGDFRIYNRVITTVEMSDLYNIARKNLFVSIPKQINNYTSYYEFKTPLGQINTLIKYPREAMSANTKTYTDGTVVNVSISSEYNTTDHSRWSSFNGLTNDVGWCSSASKYTSGIGIVENVLGYKGEWLMIDLGEVIMIDSFKIYQRTLSTARMPKKFRFYASNDINAYNNVNHSSWNLIYDDTGYYPTSNTIRTCTIGSTKPYRYFFIVVNENYNDGYVQFAELEIYGFPITTITTTQFPRFALTSDSTIMNNITVRTKASSKFGSRSNWRLFDRNTGIGNTNNINATGWTNSIGNYTANSGGATYTGTTLFAVTGYYGEWIMIDLGEQTVISQMKLWRNINDVGWFQRHPRNYRLYGSNDATAYDETSENWTQIFDKVDTTASATPLTNPTNDIWSNVLSFRYYALVINKIYDTAASITNGGYVEFYELQLFSRNFSAFKTNTITFTKDTVCDVLVVGGGGSGGVRCGGGGGAGACIYMQNYTFPSGTYNIVIGDGGSSVQNTINAIGIHGDDSYIQKDGVDIFRAIGGAGGGFDGTNDILPGGSSGGASASKTTSENISTLNIPLSGYIYGNKGGVGFNNVNASYAGGGGGGAGNIGGNAVTHSTSTGYGGKGGDGKLINITGRDLYYAAGGGGGIGPTGIGGMGGSGIGGNGSVLQAAALNGVANTGSGGGGSGFASGTNLNGISGAGGSGIVIIKWNNFADNSHINYNDVEIYNNNIVIGKTKYLDNFKQYGIIRKYPPSNFTGSTTSAFVIISNTITGQTYGNGIYSVSWSSYNGTVGLGADWLFNGVKDENKFYNANPTYIATSGVMTASNTMSLGNTNYFGEWIKIKMPLQIYLAYIKIYALSQYLSRSPAIYRVYGSNNDINWTLLIDNNKDAIYTNLDGTTNSSLFHTSPTANLKQSDKYFYFALCVNKIKGQDANAVYLNFSELELYGSETFTKVDMISNYNFYTDTTDIKVWYEFDNLTDNSGNGLTLTNSGATFDTTLGNYVTGTGAIKLGTASFANLNSPSDYYFSPNTSFTYSFWLKSNNNPSNHQVIVNSRNNTTQGWNVVRLQNETTIYFEVFKSSATATKKYEIGSSWNHFVCVLEYVSATLQNMSLYMNGVFKELKSGNIYDPYTQGALYFGKSATGIAYNVANNTFIDDFRMYNRVLNLEEIQILYYRRKIQDRTVYSIYNDKTNLALQYDFDTTNILLNKGYLGSSHDLTSSGTLTSVSGAVDLSNGTYLTVNSALDTTGWTECSICFRLKRTALNTNSWDTVFLSPTGDIFSIQRYSGTSNWAMNIFGSGWIYTTSTTLNDFTADNIWNHYVFVFNKEGTQVRIKIYKNGNFDPIFTNLSGTWNNGTHNLIMSNSEIWKLKGLLDDVRIYDKILTIDEIQTLNDMVYNKVDTYDDILNGSTDYVSNTSNTMIVPTGNIVTYIGDIISESGNVNTNNLLIEDNLYINTSIRDYSSNIMTKYPRFPLTNQTTIYPSPHDNITVTTEMSSEFFNDTTDMLAWYKFDGNLTDSSGNGNDAVLASGTNQYDTSIRKQGLSSLSFNSSTVYSCTPSTGTDPFNSDTITVSVWHYSTTNINSHQSILSTRPSSGLYGFTIYIQPSTNNMLIIQYGTSTTWDGISTTFQIIPNSTWRHICFTVNENKLMSVYINGELIETKTLSNFVVNTDKILYIGANIGGTNYKLTNGTRLDDVRIYNRALTQEEITKLYSYSTSYLAFNNDKTTVGWNINPVVATEYFPGYTGEYLEIDLGEYILPTQLVIAAVPEEVNKTPKNFRLYGAQSKTIIYDNGLLASPSRVPGSADYYFAFTSITGQNYIIFNEDTECDILVVGGGGGGGSRFGGGGGAGGVSYYINQTLNGTYNITVGDGGTGGVTTGGGGTYGAGQGTNGNDSFIQKNSIDVFRGKGGGGGGRGDTANGSIGGSGGGAAGRWAGTGGSANQGSTYWNGISYIVGGYNGGSYNGSGNFVGAGGGGAGGIGFNTHDSTQANRGKGGIGIQNSITGNNIYYAGGGGGGSDVNGTTQFLASGGLGGGGIGGGTSSFTLPTVGQTNTGGGGGGGCVTSTLYNFNIAGAKGGSGIVIIRWRSSDEIKNYDLLLDNTTTETEAQSDIITYTLSPLTSYRYFTLVVNSNWDVTTSEIKISEMEIYGFEQPPIYNKYPRENMTANTKAYTDGSGVTVNVTGSTSWDTGTNNYWNSFSGTTNDYGWGSGAATYTALTGVVIASAFRTGYAGEYMMIDLGEQIIMNNIKIYPRIDGNCQYRTPKDFKIFASNSSTSYGTGNQNTGWVEIYTGSASGNGSQLTPYSYIIGNTTSYRYYMIVINKIFINATSTLVQFAELEIYGIPGNYVTTISSSKWKVAPSTTTNELEFSTSTDNGDNWVMRSMISATATGSYTNFTGIHHCKANKKELYDDKYIGRIVSSTKKYSSINSLYGGDNIKRNLDKTEWDCLPIVELSSKQNDKNVFGIITKVEDDHSKQREYQTGYIMHYYDKELFDRRLHIAGVGEGGIWVCDYNGSVIESGDYITSSPLPGFGMKQHDDLQHSYTSSTLDVPRNFLRFDFNFSCCSEER